MKRTYAALAATAVTLSAFSAHAQTGPTVRIASGQLQGAVAGGIESYKGIPYAAPPTGELRWRPPAEAATWSSPRAATAFGPICPQKGNAYMAVKQSQSEDCLTLNVWTPSRTGRAPVMVWIHGGSWNAGSAAQPTYDGTAFARDGVVLVSINYRLGALGYFAHPALTAEAGPTAPLASYGQMDMVAALRWVQKNIAAFGGDPAQVTVFGESAGGASVLALLATPSARGLFSKAIVESGPAFGAPRTLATEERAGVSVATKAGLGPTATAAQLRALPVAALVANQGTAGPIVDGRLQPAPVELAALTGRLADVPLIIGTNADEGSLVESIKGVGDVMLAQLKPDERTTVTQAYAAEAPDTARLGRTFFADLLFGAPARWIANRESSGAPVWLYRFSYVTPVMRKTMNGAQHAWELGYVFDTVGQGRLPAAPADLAYAKVVHSCWVAFAKTGAPTCTGAPAWPAYTPARDTLTHFADTGPVLVTGFRKPQFDLVEKIVATRMTAATDGAAPAGR